MVNVSVNKIVAVAVFGVLSVSCSDIEIQRSLAETCIPSPVDLALPIHQRPEIEIGPTPVPFPDVWEVIATFDQSVDDALGYLQSLIILDDKSVWLSGSGNFVYRVDLDTLAVRKYEFALTGENEISFVRLFLSEKGGLWAIFFEDRGSFETGTISISLLNDEEDRFVSIVVADILDGSALIERITKGDRIVEDENGVLWISYKPTLIRFDPSSKMIEKVEGVLTGFRVSDTFISEESFLFLVAAEKSSDASLPVSNYGLYSYNGDTGQINLYKVQPDIGSPFNLFLDHAERLWQDDFSYIDLTHPDDLVWYKVIRSPVFISDRSLSYSWPEATPVLESLNRYLWFDSDTGVAVLDFETNEWCLLTTFSSRIVKDTDENVWMANDGKIYKLTLQP